MTTITTPDAIEASAPPVIRYRTQGGAIVRVIEVKGQSSNPQDYRFVGQCAGCLSTGGSTRIPLDIDGARSWAEKHSAECRALPQLADEAQSVSAVYLGAAHDLIERARNLTARGASEADRGKAVTLVTVAEGALTFALAAHQIEGF